jgi:glycosidase
MAIMTQSIYPSLFQVSTRAWLTELSAGLGRAATLDDIPDAALDRIADNGFDWVWPLGVWQTGAAGREVSRSRPEWRREYEETLPDLSDADICGSCFAITAYRVHRDLGGNAALRRLRRRLAERGLKLMLDFVPNHTALDHPWIEDHPDFFIAGSESDLARTPENYCRVKTLRGPIVLAHGRDPYFPGWPDTLQLNYGNPELQLAMRGEILAVADLCDGVRCDMAMLILAEVFQRTWGIAIDNFWPEAIAGARRSSPGFTFMAEVYWDLEWTLMQQGFDYAYDKRLYDRLREQNAGAIRDHLVADLDYQRRLARFLENHDEPRAAAVFPPGVHQAAAVVTFLAPGLRFFHDGQFEGRKKRLPVHLCRRAAEEADTDLEAFYRRLLDVLRAEIFRNGHWRLLSCAPAWQGNGSCDGFIAFLWEHADGSRMLVAVNYAPHQGQCLVRLPVSEFSGKAVQLADLMSEARYQRQGDDLVGPGLYLDLPAWGYNVFELIIE